MKIKNRTTKLYVIMLSFMSMMLLTACQPEDSFKDNGLVSSDLDASFTITPTGVTNRYTLEAQSIEGVLTNWWDSGDGSGKFRGRVSEEIFLPDAGTYTVSHTVVGIGGKTFTSSKELIVEQSDPNAGNIVLGGKLDTPDDIGNWTVLNISASGTEWTFANGKATVQGGGWNQKGIYQAIDVIGGKTYKIDMLVSSTSGVSNTWFEVFASPTQPVDGSDYSAGGKLITINTWAGCGSEPFSGKLSVVGCDLAALTYPGEPGKFVAESTGTIYLVIKCGGENLRDGISVDNIEMRGVN